MLENKSIYIAVLNQGDIRTELVRMLLRISHQRKYNLTFHFPFDKPIAHNRNKIVKDFLDNSTDDYLLMIDSDCIITEDILNLADFQKDVMGTLGYCFQNQRVVPLVLDKNKDKPGFHVKNIEDGAGLVECDAVGTGVIMLSRKVLSSIKHPFENIYDEDGIKTTGLDLEFCNRAKAKGFKIYCHTDYKISHWTDFDLKTMYNTYLQLKHENKTN